MRLVRTVAAITAMSWVGSVSAADSTPITVKDIEVVPRANLTADDGTLKVHPKAMVGVGYNDNIFATETNEKDDVYGRGLAGLFIDWRMNPHSSISVNGEIEGLSYAESENDEGNMVGGLVDLDYKWRDNSNSGVLHGGYQRYDDPLIETGQQILRENFVGFGQLRMQGASMRTVLDVSARATDYLEDGFGFSKDSRDNTIYGATVRLGTTTARETFYYALLGVDRIDYWDNIQFNDSTGVTGGLGTQVRLGERSTLKAEAGVTYRMYEDNYKGNANYDDEEFLAPYVSIAAKFPWETGSHFGVTVFSRIDESLTANAAWVYGGIIDGRLRLLARSGLFASAGFYHSEDSGEGPGIVLAERDTFEASGGVEHEITTGVVTRLKATYTDSDTEVANAFTRLIVALDLAVAF